MRWGGRTLAEDLALPGTAPSPLLHGHPWRVKSVAFLETELRLSK